jgi:hypothetical protein
MSLARNSSRLTWCSCSGTHSAGYYVLPGTCSPRRCHQKHIACAVVEGPQDGLHQPLEIFRSVAEDNGHNCELLEALAGGERFLYPHGAGPPASSQLWDPRSNTTWPGVSSDLGTGKQSCWLCQSAFCGAARNDISVLIAAKHDGRRLWTLLTL